MSSDCQHKASPPYADCYASLQTQFRRQPSQEQQSVFACSENSVCVCVCVCVCMSMHKCVCVCVTENEHASICVCACHHEHVMVCVCVCVCVCGWVGVGLHPFQWLELYMYVKSRQKCIVTVADRFIWALWAYQRSLNKIQNVCKLSVKISFSSNRQTDNTPINNVVIPI